MLQTLRIPSLKAVASGRVSRQTSTRRQYVVCSAAPIASKEQLFTDLGIVLDNYRRAPPSEKFAASSDVMDIFKQLSAVGGLTKWGNAIENLPTRRTVNLGELRFVGVKAPDAIAKVSVRNDASFLFTVVGASSIAAVALSRLPGDWGFFSSYLVGGVPIVVLALGSVNPGILQFAIDIFSQVFPDYRERILRHEAAHFLTAHLLGVPVANYSLIIGKEHTDLAEAALQRRLIEKVLEDDEVDRLSIIAIAGATAEAMHFEDVMGQTQDLFDLQRIMNRSTKKLGAQQQQNQTRWAAYQAASLLRQYSKEYEALMEVMENRGTVAECVRAIENC